MAGEEEKVEEDNAVTSQPPAGLMAAMATDAEDSPVDASLLGGARGSDSEQREDQTAPASAPATVQLQGDQVRQGSDADADAAASAHREQVSMGSDADAARGSEAETGVHGMVAAPRPQLQPTGGSGQNDRVSRVEVAQRTAGVHAAAVYNPVQLNAAEGREHAVPTDGFVFHPGGGFRWVGSQGASAATAASEGGGLPERHGEEGGGGASTGRHFPAERRIALVRHGAKGGVSTGTPTRLGVDLESLFGPRPSLLTPRRNIGVIGDGKPARATRGAGADAPAAAMTARVPLPLDVQLERRPQQIFAPPRRDGLNQSLHMLRRVSAAFDLPLLTPSLRRQQVLPPRDPSLHLVSRRHKDGEPRPEICIISREEVELGWAALVAARRECECLRIQNHELAGAVGEAALRADRLQNECLLLRQALLQTKLGGASAGEHVCRDCFRPAETMVRPCYHICFCNDCYDRRQKCPCCHTKIDFSSQ